MTFNRLIYASDCLVSLALWKMKTRIPLPYARYRVNGALMTVRPLSMDAVICYENMEMAVYDPFIPQFVPGDTVIDIGAHIGSFSVHTALAQRSGIRIFAYEPHPVSYKLLTENIKFNQVGKTVTARRSAVSDTRGRVRLHMHRSNTGSNSIFGSSDYAGNISVPTVTLADVFSENNIRRCRFLKLDCEGAEMPILSAAPAGLWKRIDSVVTEIHPNYPESGLTGLFKRNGFFTRIISGRSDRGALERFASKSVRLLHARKSN
ncbi:hypothetical protein A2Z33_00565 [Candidatus Gottesmanbacteria bacterium RBG_16_52_11]|uniref:Methyltransferase FkbM domain-containing protein n=1 Tax=Candidatus Gottesmanbacteria bacterium RBG_16_52_11 TaxID=1798374 RepID=A0A1F5YN42_9BACT|nr:MAG: hypothetical protein A2Z33_00565 [Candidatus Gottesmanbacteria bacterium RBG_16_52_11]